MACLLAAWPLAALTPAAAAPVLAAGPGVVEYTGHYFADGTVVDLRQPDGVVRRYAHLSRIAAGITPGVAVRAGDLLGEVGMPLPRGRAAPQADVPAPYPAAS